MCVRWAFTVASLRYKAMAISRVVLPAVRNARTSCSRSVREESARFMVVAPGDVVHRATLEVGGRGATRGRCGVSTSPATMTLGRTT
jgi:hypothetical protein